MTTNYPVFAEYHLYIKRWLEVIMELPRLKNLGLKIPVRYSTPRRAFSIGASSMEAGDAGGGHFYAPPSQGNNWLPIMTFRQTNMTPILSKTIPYEHVLRRKVKDNNNNIVGEKRTKPMLPYELTYSGTLYTGLMQDADMLIFRFITEFKPQCYIWVGPEDAVNDGTKGLWATMELESVSDGTEYEPGDIAERVVRKDFIWQIKEAYVPTMESRIDENIIREVYGDIFSVEDEESLR